MYGVRNAGELLCKYDLEDWRKRDDISLNVTIDHAVPGWTGLMESVPVVLKEVASISDNAVAIVCGPPIIAEFTKPVIDEPGVQPENVPLSLDMKMKYGIGKCGRCNTGDKFVCRDGLVFTYKELQSMLKE